MNIKYRQHPTADQVTQMPTAVVVKGNPAFINNNPLANKFYDHVAKMLRGNKYSVTFDKGEPYTIPPKADLWIGHSRGADRLRFAPKGTKTIDLNKFEHPAAKNWLSRQVEGSQEAPPPHHYIFTNEQKNAIMNIIRKK